MDVFEVTDILIDALETTAGILADFDDAYAVIERGDTVSPDEARRQRARIAAVRQRFRLQLTRLRSARARA